MQSEINLKWKENRERCITKKECNLWGIETSNFDVGLILKLTFNV